MKMLDLDILTYSERKAFRKGRDKGHEEGRLEERRESARRMRSLGFDNATIATALDVSEAEAAALLATPTPNAEDSSS